MQSAVNRTRSVKRSPAPPFTLWAVDAETSYAPAESAIFKAIMIQGWYPLQNATLLRSRVRYVIQNYAQTLPSNWQFILFYTPEAKCLADLAVPGLQHHHLETRELKGAFVFEWADCARMCVCLSAGAEALGQCGQTSPGCFLRVTCAVEQPGVRLNVWAGAVMGVYVCAHAHAQAACPWKCLGVLVPRCNHSGPPP